MNPTAWWPWERIAFICFLTAIAATILGLMFGAGWSFLSGAALWGFTYSLGRSHQTDALGIKKIERAISEENS
jgi:hypothetical protein